ncbi:MAG: hypothetical protein ISS92_02830 [Candidatus Omnitrophica bacterium]|nr:hypothetical protein [Candidatus Omnitrophota bacterium]
MKKILLFTLFLLCFAAAIFAAPDEKTAAYEKVKEYTASGQSFKYVLSAEGEFITVFNDDIAPWIKRKLDASLVAEIRAALEPRLRIELNDKGFVSAATRQTSDSKDVTGYDAIWVRDNVWIYYSLLGDPQRSNDARRLILALWDYYSTPEQVSRFKDIIAHPERATDAMAMPHIRFDSNSPNLTDVKIDGKPQVWNHRQIDAHGIFFTALGEALQNGLLNESDLTEARAEPLALYPLFLAKIQFYAYEDAGSWEELPRKNTSSIGLATHSLQIWNNIMYGTGADNKAGVASIRKTLKKFIEGTGSEIISSWSESSLEKLSALGLKEVKRQLALGGESPDYSPTDVHFRLADAAMLALIQPSALEGLSEEDMRNILLIVETLKRPAGVLRYNNDSYQGGNYWIEAPVPSGSDKPALTGDTSSQNAFLWRLGTLIPNTEAEWFFDSLMAMACVHLARITTDPELRRIDMHLAAIHIKRALGQITAKAITADGKPVDAWLTPESINTVLINGHEYYLPSPIVPLNWAKAALSMALREYEKTLERYEFTQHRQE